MEYNNGNMNNNKESSGRKFLVAAIAAAVFVLLVAGVVKIASGFGSEDEAAVLPTVLPTKLEENEAEETVKPIKTEQVVFTAPSSTEAAEEAELAEDAEEAMTPQEIARKVMPSVVCIQNYQKITRYNYSGGYEIGGYYFGGEKESSASIEIAGEGSGIILSEEGYIATNAHVINGAELLKVILSNGEIYQAELIGTDPDTDLALIKIDAQGLVPAIIGESDELEIAETVMAIGNPGGSVYANSVSLGIVSAKNRQVDYIGSGYTLDMIQTDAAINPGNSGGALVNMEGEIVGICSMKYVDTKYEGLGFAISTKEAMPILKELLQYGEIRSRAVLGISGVELDALSARYYGLREGIYVSTITNKNCGELKAGDIIFAIEGQEVLTLQNVKAALRGKKAGDSVELSCYRASDKSEYKTILILTGAEGSITK